MNRQGLLLT